MEKMSEQKFDQSSDALFGLGLHASIDEEVCHRECVTNILSQLAIFLFVDLDQSFGLVSKPGNVGTVN